MPQSSKPPTVVVGAGPAGMATALALARAGLPVVLVERSDAVGGKVRTVDDPERRYEHGVHGWWPCYVNFDRLLRWADVAPDRVLQPAIDLRMLIEDGQQVPIAALGRYVPSPVFLLLQALRTPALNLKDIVHLGRFFVHLLAYDPIRDERLYAQWSFEQFLDYVGVTKRTKEMFFEAWVKAFCYSRREQISAAVALASFRCYVMPSDRGSIPRWLGGFSHDQIFGALENKLRALGACVLTSTAVTAIDCNSGEHVRVALVRPPDAPADDRFELLGPAAIGTVERAAADAPGGASVIVGGEPLLVRSKPDGSYEAISRRCAHAGCELAWDAVLRQFKCPCHGGAFDGEGLPIAGPPSRPLEKLSAAVSDQAVEITRPGGGAAIDAEAVVLATDVAGTLSIVSNTPAVDVAIRHTIGHLATTSLIVIRFWFDPSTPLQDKPQSALTPLLPMIDAYFCLSRILKGDAAPREHVVEVQLAAAKDHYLELDDDALAALALEDLRVVSADYRRDRMLAYRVQRHIDVFSAFPPGTEGLGLPAEIVEDVFIAGDWAPRPGNSWMMERAVASGVARAADVLKGRGIGPPDEVLRPSGDGWLLRLASTLAFLWRSIVRRGFTVPEPMTVKEMIEHDRVDHVINGWACIAVGFCALLPLFDRGFDALLKVWPAVFTVVNIYFFFHVEPWVRVQYGSWLRSLADKHSFQHRLMTGGGIAAGTIELGLAFNYLHHSAWRAFFPLGSIAFGVLFTLHHWGEDPLADRQHRDIGFLAMVGGACLGMARYFEQMQNLRYVWPVLVLCQAYLFVSYMSTTLHGHAIVVEVDDHHDHTH